MNNTLCPVLLQFHFVVNMVALGYLQANKGVLLTSLSGNLSRFALPFFFGIHRYIMTELVQMEFLATKRSPYYLSLTYQNVFLHLMLGERNG